MNSAGDEGARFGWDCHAHVFVAGAPTRSGHYAPTTRGLAELEREAAASNVGRVVLVQPSVYGTDNSLMLEALRARKGHHRGVAVVDRDVTDWEMIHMHDHGVRGIRFNRVSPVGNRGDALETLAPRLREFGWHVQWYTTPEYLPQIAAIHAAHGLACVLDHLAGFTADSASNAAHWTSLERLAGLGAWIKLSGWYRLRALEPYDALDGLIARVGRIFDARCVWGSDWPHTWFLEAGRGRSPAYGELLQPLTRALGSDNAQRVLCEYPSALYE